MIPKEVSMKRQHKRLGLLLAAVASSLILAAHGAPAPAAESPELRLLAHLPLKGPNANLWVHKKILYVGGDGASGVKLIDIADPARPTLITSLTHRAGTSFLSPKVISVNTPAFK